MTRTIGIVVFPDVEELDFVGPLEALGAMAFIDRRWQGVTIAETGGRVRARDGPPRRSVVNPYLGIDGLTLLEQGLTSERALEKLIEGDRGRDLRQVAIVDRDGHTAAYTGDKCIPWAGQG